jgi:hypothetical protein
MQVRIAKSSELRRTVFRASKSEGLSCFHARQTIEAMGGNLSLVAEFPNREPVVLSGIAEHDPGQR